MRSKEDLKNILSRIDGWGYKAYKDIEGDYDFGDFLVLVDYVQGDPFASPSRIRFKVPQGRAKFPPDLFQNRVKARALRDFLTRKFAAAIQAIAKGGRGMGGSGRIIIDLPGQEVLERTSCFVNKEEVEVRFTLGLPAAGRTILGRQAEEVFFDEIPRIGERAFFY